MPEIVRTLGLLTALPGSLVVLAMGLARATQASPPNWILLIIGGALFVLSVPPLLFGSSPDDGRGTSDRGARRPVPTRAR
ncbi:hypothetical protein [Actinomycetospora sp. TBRC 11914]|uniref:hypothetical protein n=1 Tax=Actinomycetospora sp. TBRC 11914 TaxID=2729387 RepID=UPI00145DB246|nr:hypothetical protein [Actinomycetospora sp. TBRC 11914]NMO90927.1 hypothetical protein [Actinomycetospora sp. TBRC 11914]